MTIKAIIFDFDGVIAETEHVHRHSWEVLSEKLNLGLPEGFLDSGIGSTNDLLAEELVRFWKHKVDFQTIIDIKCNAFNHLVSEMKDVLIPGILEALAYFQEKGLPMAIATSSPRLEIAGILSRFELSKFFKDIVTLDDVTSPKPDPQAYQKAAGILGQDPKDCLVFEDSIIGSTAARAAGCQLIGITSSYSAEDLQPTLTTMENFLSVKSTLDKLDLLP
ncbi:MAG: HAD family phosphatase [Pseudobacteriovorax sp.]|nr:HAD family phosphatase [Pseudobacteriovorax sp.]